MDRQSRIDEVYEAMSNVHDMDTSLTDFAKAAVECLGWRDVNESLPDIDDVVVCTNGKARWLDRRTASMRELKCMGHTATHWHPLADVSEVAALHAKSAQPSGAEVERG